VLVFHDLLGLHDGHQPKFVRRYASLKGVAVEAVTRFAEDVRAGRYPTEAESYRFADNPGLEEGSTPVPGLYQAASA
jgi:3-methyl-2-oxobutanoate hydroxymethyltransferase